VSDSRPSQTPEGEAVTWGAIAGLIVGLVTFQAARAHVPLIFPAFFQIALLARNAAPRLAAWRLPQTPALLGAVLVGLIVVVVASILFFKLFGDFAQRVERRAARHGERREMERRRRKERQDFEVT
jgi:RsiW-degrading membrane proteinase PrsW (M82 family)